MRLLSLTVIFLFICSTATAAPDGKALFAEHCAACHGLDGMGGVGTPLALKSFLDTVSDDYLTKTIRNGRPGRIMPPFQNLSNSEVKAIAAHVRSWSDQPAPEETYPSIKGDPKKGSHLFAEHCAECHGLEGEGGEGTGVTFSRPRDLPIIPPALNNSGFLASASNQMIRDSIRNGRKGTPMKAYQGKLTGQQIDDITIFIRSLEGSARQPAQIEDNTPMVLKVESSYGFEETIENVRNAAGSANFVVIRTGLMEHGLFPKGEENQKAVFVDFCSFSFLSQALNIDPRIGIFLPCRISIVEQEGKVYIMSVNPQALGSLYNNNTLDEACTTMSDMYQSILDEATL